MDLSKAFDFVPHNFLIAKLYTYSFRLQSLKANKLPFGKKAKRKCWLDVWPLVTNGNWSPPGLGAKTNTIKQFSQ